MRSIIISVCLLVALQTIGQIPTNGLVAHYPFNGNADEAMGVVSGINGVLNGVVPTTGLNGNPGTGLLFNGNNNSTWIDIADNQIFDFGTGDYSVSIWLKYISPQPGNGYNYSMVFCKGGFVETSPGLSVFADFLQTSPSSGGASTGAFTIRSSADDYASVNLNSVVNDNQWHHFVFSRVGNELRIYADKVLQATRISLLENLENSYPLRFGANQEFTNAQNFTGSMDEVRFYNRALTEQEISNIYQSEMPTVDISSGLVAYFPFNGNANDESGHNNNGVVSGASLTVDRLGNNNGCYSFDGSSRIVCPDLNLPMGNTPRTISSWISASQLQSIMGSGNPPGHIVKYGVEGVETQHCNISLWGNYIRFSNWSSPPDADYGFTHPVDEWFQVITRLDAENVASLFINGSLVYSTTVENWNTLSSGSMILGDYLTNGKLDDIRIYNRALTQQEISELYNSEKPPVTISSGLIAYYPFNGNPNDESGNLNHGVNYGATLVADRSGGINKAYSFNGLTDTIRITSQRNVLGNRSRSIAAWIKLPESPNSFNTIYKGGDNGDGNDFTFIVKSVYAGIIQLYVRRYNDDIWSEDFSYTPGQWMHVAVSYDGTNGARMKFYLNGNLKGTINGGSQTFNTVATNPVIGNHISQGGFYHFFKGEIDDLMVYDRALSQSEIRLLTNNGNVACSNAVPWIVSSSISSLTGDDGLLPITINVNSCQNNSWITDFEYWFDGIESNTTKIPTENSGYLNFGSKINCEDLAIGNHLISFRFVNNLGAKTEISSNSFSKNEMKEKIVRFPTLRTTFGKVLVGQLQKISGDNFSNSGRVGLYMKGPDNEFIDIPSPLVYYENGSVSCSFNIPPNFLHGKYTLFAEDLATSVRTSEISFYVFNPIDYHMALEIPTSHSVYNSSVQFSLVWRDYVSKDNPIGKSGIIGKRYKIELFSQSIGAWTTLEEEFVPKDLLGDALNGAIRYNLSLKNSGLYKVRITDNNNPTNLVVSDNFEVVSATGEYRIGFHWDKSSPIKAMVPPKGLAADGVARMIVRLQKTVPDDKVVNRIKATILPVESTASGANLLGKISFRHDAIEYSLEGNYANNVIADTIIQTPSNEYQLWLVAPDDFTVDQQDVSRSRRIRIRFDINYSSGHPTQTFYSNDIEIVRPPLMWVHGLNGDEGSFKKAKYLLNGSPLSFFNASESPWVINERVRLINYESFGKNARILLGMDYYSSEFPHTIKYFLDAMHHKGYASNRVDYVGHSMGGSVARAMINDYQNIYRPAKLSSEDYKNYDSGFINKLITVNTPHNGSPYADFLKNHEHNLLLFSASGWNTIFINELGFWHNSNVSQAVLDLRFTKPDGIGFAETKGVRNHLIASDVFKDVQIDRGKSANHLLLKSDWLSKVLMSAYASATFSKVFIPPLNGNNELWDDADLVVPVSSQLAGYDKGLADDITLGNFTGGKSRTIIYGDENNKYTKINTITHTQITDNAYVGKRIFVLLNSAIGSTRFESSIPQNPNGISAGSSKTYNSNKNNVVKQFPNSQKYSILSPLPNAAFGIDSVIDIKILLLDTVNLRKVQVLFQSQYFESNSNVLTQRFYFKVGGYKLGDNQILVNAVYDSMGVIVNYFDSVSIEVNSASVLQEFKVVPNSLKVNKNEYFSLDYKAVYENSIVGIGNDNSSLVFSIADTNVVVYDILKKQFLSKDTGSTFIEFEYNGFKDTAYVYLSFKDNQIVSICPGQNVELQSGFYNQLVNYKWQVDSGFGYIDLTDGFEYQGSGTPTLTLLSVPTNSYKFSYRCVMESTDFEKFSQEFNVKFQVKWTGDINDDWFNSLNWSCGVVPDEYTDVILPYGKLSYPVLSTSTSINSLKLEGGASVILISGSNLILKNYK